MKSLAFSGVFSVSLVVSIATSILMTGCTGKNEPGFALEGSKIRYETSKFESPDILAEVNGNKITFNQILDKSEVLKDLAKQENEVMIGLAYLKAVEKTAEKPESKSGNVEIHLPKTATKLEPLLSRLGRKPLAGFDVSYVTTKSEDPKLLAKFGSISVTRDDIDYDHFVLQSIEKRRFSEIATQFNSQISRILLNEEATKAGKPLQEYVNEKVLGGKKVEITETDLQAYLTHIGFTQSELTPEKRAQFMLSLAQRKEQSQIENYVAENLISGPVKVAFREPYANVRLDQSWKPDVGVSDAPISIVAFSGTTCPDCSQFIGLVSQIMEKHAGHLKLNWIHTFGESDGIANMLAEGALCVEDQKRGSSLQFIKDFSPTAFQSDENAFYKWAKEHGLSDEKLKACFTGGKSKALLAQQQVYSRKAGIVANPTLWIDGVLIEGAVRPEDVENVVNQRISQHGSTWFGAFIRRLKARF